MKKLSALLFALMVSSGAFAQQTGEFQIGNTKVQGTATAGPNGTTVVTNASGQTMTLTPGANPGTFTVTQSTIPGVTAGAGTTVSVSTASAAGFGAVGAGGAIAAGVAFVAVVTTSNTNKGTTPGSTAGSV